MPRIVVIGKFEPAPMDMLEAVEVDTTSHGSFKDLSPFYLGPVVLPTGERCLKFENFWQYSKVYAQHVNSNGWATDDYIRWRQEGFLKDRANRYPMGKGAKPLFSIKFDLIGLGSKLNYIEARKQLYIPYYTDLVRKTKSYALLYKWFHNEKRDLLLRDFDGYDNRSLGVAFKDVVNNPNRSMGHAFIIMAMITGELAFGLGQGGKD